MTRSAVLPRPASPAAWPRWAVWLAAAVALAIMAGVLADRRISQDVPRLDPASLRPGFGAGSFAEVKAQADRRVAAARASLALGEREWLRQEGLAKALIARWKVAGDYADLAQAQDLLDRGLAAAPYPSGPVITRAMLAVLVHRLDQADSALARKARAAAPEPGQAADAAALAGDIALQRGRLRDAADGYRRAERIAPTPGYRLRSAVLAAQTGEPDQGAAALEALIAEPRQPPAALAELMLQRANLAYWSGDWAEAGRWVGAAQRALPGYWLADAYAAQQFALAGRTDQALRAYRIVAARSGRPEVMDALAHLLRLQGRAQESRAWAARAAAGWRARAALFPEAVAHHQAEHELAVGSAASALAFAQADAARRPQAPNLVLLARALLSAGRPREALAALDRADAQGWASAGQETARAEVAAAVGEGAASAAARAKAEAINPRAADPGTRLIWFGHD